MEICQCTRDLAARALQKSTLSGGTDGVAQAINLILSGAITDEPPAQPSTAANMEPWPFTKFDFARDAGPKGSAVLLTTGAMNPAHRGHAAMLHQARLRLEADGVAVLGAFVSPSHDAYVQPKAASLGTIGLSSQFRLQAAQRTVADDPLVSVGAWEAQQSGNWPDFPEVCAALQAALTDLATSHGREAVRCFYVCGSDHANKCGLWSSRPSMQWGGVVVVPRAGDALAGSEDVSFCVYVAEPASDTSAL